MSMLRHTTGGWTSQRGASVAQSAAVALAAAVFIGAILLVVPQLGTRVDTSFKCLVGVLSGGGTAACAGGATSTADDGAPKTFEDLGGEDCDAACQIIGFLKGFGEGFWDMLKGLASMAKDIFLLITGDEETWAKYKQLIEAFLNDPVGVAKALLGELAAPIIEDWKAGRYGEATGRLLYEVISTIGGTKGLDKLAKLGKLGKTADKVEDVGGAAKKVDDLPVKPVCTVWAPTGKAPGLAKPLAGCWGDRFANAPKAVKDGITALENRMDAARAAGQHAFANGLEAQLKRAYELQKQGKLKGVEVTEGNGRYDFVLTTDEVVEFKYWSNTYTNNNITKLADQVEKYSNSGKPVILELARTKNNPITPEVVNKLKQELADRGVTNVTINIVDVAEP